MIYRHDNLPGGNLPEQIYNYLSNFISDLEYDSGTGTITFFGKFSFQTPPNAGWPHLVLYWGSNSISWGGGINMVGNKDIYFLFDENFMSLKISFTERGRWMMLTYFKSEDGKYYVGGNCSGTVEYSLYDTPYYDVQDPIVTAYNFAKVLNFVAAPGKIVYAEQTPVAHNDSDAFFMDTIYCCSTVPIRSTVSIGNDNYIAIDTNNIVILDSE